MSKIPIMTIAEQLRQEARYEGMQQGMHKGEHEKALSIARNMLFKNADLSFVKEVTGLSDQDLENLSQNH